MMNLTTLTAMRGAKTYKTQRGAQDKLNRAEFLYAGAKKDDDAVMPVLTTIVSGVDANGKSWYVPVAILNNTNMHLAGFLAHLDIFVTDGSVGR